ncbi:hypothetical protein POPTR_T125504v4 [Populus trichocarpa]|uniref:Uncharacterized protein n=1 Tax=Populus trichocarpa TaxID=3694 RepID=A0ACC0RGS7_POPTR|nr:hypothetical protein POPTR_T125504v4 [Populus trichocarpa]|eukprot:XP_024464177.1 uncharacterized protein LOC18109015 isoform X1 [Populus trichocarpa]
MACGSHESHVSDPFSSTPPQASPSASPSPQRNPKEHDQCFVCKRLGHWSKDCPNKTPPKSLVLSPGSSSSPSVQVPDLPVVRCPCGGGTCRVSTSNTVKNPGRKFYACPVDHRTSGSCGFFKWSDDIAARFKPPMCPCGAGSCSLNIVSSGPDRGRWYFACRIKKNHGACKFFQWADSEGNIMPNKHGDESKGYPARRYLFAVNNELCTEDNRSSDIELESTMVESVDNYPISSMDPPIRKDEVLVRDLVMQDSESCDIVAGTALEVPPPIPKPEIPCQEPEFSLQISAARHTKSEGVYFLGTSPFDPVIEDVGDIEGLALLAGSSSNDGERDIQQGPFLQSRGC